MNSNFNHQSRSRIPMKFLRYFLFYEINFYVTLLLNRFFIFDFNLRQTHNFKFLCVCLLNRSHCFITYTKSMNVSNGIKLYMPVTYKFSDCLLHVFCICHYNAEPSSLNSFSHRILIKNVLFILAK